MPQKNYKKLFISILIIANSFAYAQCMCADIQFKLQLADDVSFYSIKTTKAPFFDSIKNWRAFRKHEIDASTINFKFETGGGIDSLVFVIRNNKTNKNMQITVLNMGYDNPYFIDLTNFTEGNFLFDWNKIMHCQRNNTTAEIVNCEGMKFYQLPLELSYQLKKINTFWDRKIKPFDLKYFADN